MRRLQIKRFELEAAFATNAPEARQYLDLQTGNVLAVSDEIEDVTRIESNPERFLLVAPLQSGDSFADRVAFTEAVADETLRTQLQRVLHGRGAFRRFRETLHGAFREQKPWEAYRQERLLARMTEWLSQHDIEPVWVEPLPAAPPVEPRAHLLASVFEFTQAAARLSGVKRIALIGSLTTDEPEPKDADVLVTVADEMDLTPLARLTRRLTGHAQRIGRGGDVFLAQPAGEYIGRACPWKRCGFGIRQSCDAAHCGRRLYLHDDLGTIRLPPELVRTPPVELWPVMVARVTVPADVETLVLQRLSD